MKKIQKTSVRFLVGILLASSGVMGIPALAGELPASEYSHVMAALMDVARDAADLAREKNLTGEDAANFMAGIVNPSALGFKLEGSQQVSSVATAVFCAANEKEIAQVSEQVSATESATVTQVKPGTQINISDCDSLIYVAAAGAGAMTAYVTGVSGVALLLVGGGNGDSQGDNTRVSEQ